MPLACLVLRTPPEESITLAQTVRSFSIRPPHLAATLALHVHALHGEGPLWDEATSRLWWVDITGKRLNRFDPSSNENRSWPLASQPGGVVLDDMGTPIVATSAGLAHLNPPTGPIELRVPLPIREAHARANDIKIDSHGRAWVGSMALDKRSALGALFRVDGATVSQVVTGLTISNGPAFDDVARRLYLADTALGVVDVFDFDSITGSIARRRRFLDFREPGFWPDGMTVDHEGMLWLALGRAGAVHRYSPDGELRAVIELPTSNPTSVAFGGPGGNDLYITTSLIDLEPHERLRQPLAGALFVCRPGVAGPPSKRWASHGPNHVRKHVSRA